MGDLMLEMWYYCWQRWLQNVFCLDSVLLLLISERSFLRSSSNLGSVNKFQLLTEMGGGGQQNDGETGLRQLQVGTQGGIYVEGIYDVEMNDVDGLVGYYFSGSCSRCSFTSLTSLTSLISLTSLTSLVSLHSFSFLTSILFVVSFNVLTSFSALASFYFDELFSTSHISLNVTLFTMCMSACLTTLFKLTCYFSIFTVVIVGSLCSSQFSYVSPYFDQNLLMTSCNSKIDDRRLAFNSNRLLITKMNYQEQRPASRLTLSYRFLELNFRVSQLQQSKHYYKMAECSKLIPKLNIVSFQLLLPRQALLKFQNLQGAQQTPSESTNLVPSHMASGSTILTSPSFIMNILCGSSMTAQPSQLMPLRHDCIMLHKSCSSKNLDSLILACISYCSVMLGNSQITYTLYVPEQKLVLTLPSTSTKFNRFSLGWLFFLFLYLSSAFLYYY